ncbi:MAG TPA: hypothetical protein VH599_02595 [Ktedonobacterales bacterium]
MKGKLFSPFPAAQAAARHQRHFLGAAGLFAVATLVLFLTACAGPGQSGAANTTAAATNQADIVPVTTVSEQNELAPQTSSAKSYLIKVYFSRFDAPDYGAVFAVNRYSPTLGVATFAIQSLIAGPTLSESDAGYYTELNSSFSGPASCTSAQSNGRPDFRDFRLSLNKKGKVAEQGTATVQFCRPFSSAGIGVDARVTAEITATLKQFSNIKKVVILSQTGHCIGDESGMDLCLK